jgi:mRNA deadenylase 3'-5' endonuclease subunit Ccr4
MHAYIHRYTQLTDADNPCPRMGTLNTGWKLKNIFNFDEFLSQKPLFTTKTDDFAGWIDHIWVSPSVSVSSVLSPPIRSGDLEVYILLYVYTCVHINAYKCISK